MAGTSRNDATARIARAAVGCGVIIDMNERVRVRGAATAIAAAMATGGVAAPAPGQEITLFAGVLDQNWSNPLNWIGGVPDARSGDTYLATILATRTAQLDIDASVGTLATELLSKVIVGSGRTLTVHGGSIWNVGSIELKGTPVSPARLEIGGAPTVLSGSGSIVGFFEAPIAAATSSESDSIPTLENGASHLLTGSLSIGSGDLHLANSGSIIATGATTIRLAGDATSNLNAGKIRAGSGMLSIVESALTNTGTLEAAAGQQLHVIDSTIVAPKFMNSGGQYRLSGTNELVDLVNHGALKVVSGTTVLRSSAVDNGGIMCGGPGGPGTVRIGDGGLTLDGTGSLWSAPGSSFVIAGPEPPSLQPGPVVTFTNGKNHVIDGHGLIGSGWMNVDNDGYIAVHNGSTITIDAVDWFRNDGTVFTGGGTVEVLSALANFGSIVIDPPGAQGEPGGMLKVHGDFVQETGFTTIGGTVTIEDGLFKLGNGAVDLGGRLESDVWAGGGWLAVGTNPVITGYLECTIGTIIQSPVSVNGGTVTAPTLVVEGVAALGGSIYVQMTGGAAPNGTTVVLITAPVMYGAFTLAALPAGTHLEYGPTTVKLVFDGGIALGDANGDGTVDGGDLATVLGQWGACAGCTGDFDHDGFVNGADVTVVLGNWG